MGTIDRHHEVLGRNGDLAHSPSPIPIAIELGTNVHCHWTQLAVECLAVLQCKLED